MSPLIAIGNWNIAKGKLKQLFARWTHDDLEFVEGKSDELTGRIQKRAAIRRKRLRRADRLAGESSCHCGHQESGKEVN